MDQTGVGYQVECQLPGCAEASLNGSNWARSFRAALHAEGPLLWLGFLKADRALTTYCGHSPALAPLEHGDRVAFRRGSAEREQ